MCEPPPAALIKNSDSGILPLALRRRSKGATFPLRSRPAAAGTSMCLFGIRPLAGEPGRFQGPLPWPQLIEGVGVVKAAVFHHEHGVAAVTDVLAGIRTEDDQVGEFARLD